MGKLLCGKNSILEAIKFKVPIKKIYLSRYDKLFKVQNVQIIIKSKKELDQMTNVNHQGYIAEINDFKYYSFEELIKDQPKIVLILDHIQDPQNLGSIIRTANAFRIQHIVIPNKRAAKINAAVLKISSGGFIGMKITLASSLVQIINKLKKNNFWIYSSIIDDKKKSTNINKTIFNFPLALVMGNEQKGISSSLINLSDHKFYIHTPGSVQSLNVAIATAISLFKIKQVTK